MRKQRHREFRVNSPRSVKSKNFTSLSGPKLGFAHSAQLFLSIICIPVCRHLSSFIVSLFLLWTLNSRVEQMGVSWTLGPCIFLAHFPSPPRLTLFSCNSTASPSNLLWLLLLHVILPSTSQVGVVSPPLRSPSGSFGLWAFSHPVLFNRHLSPWLISTAKL